MLTPWDCRHDRTYYEFRAYKIFKGSEGKERIYNGGGTEKEIEKAMK